MKNKILLLSAIIVSLSLISGCFIYKNYQNKQKRKEEKIIANTKREFNFYTKNEIKEKPTNEVECFFNEVIKENQKNQEINWENFELNNLQKNLNNPQIEEILNIITAEQEKYKVELLDNLTEKKLPKISNTQIDQKTVIAIYKSHNFIKNLKQEKTKREEYLNKLNTLKEDLTTLKNNKNYYAKDDIYWCEDQETVEQLQNFSTKYNLALNVQQKKTETPKEAKKENGVPILCYHGVLDDYWGDASLFVKVAEFEKQMQYLVENDYTPIFTSEIKKANNYQKPIIITFDDGYKDVYTNAYPILKKYNIKANIYIISGWINGDVYMNTNELQEMASSPLIEVGSHTVTHKALASLTEDQIEEEVKTSQQQLQEITGKPIDIIAYPTGSFDNRVIAITKKYYQYALSTIKGQENPANLNQYSLRRIYVYRQTSLEAFKNLF